MKILAVYILAIGGLFTVCYIDAFTKTGQRWRMADRARALVIVNNEYRAFLAYEPIRKRKEAAYLKSLEK
jgi:hypothetical protein